MTVTHLKTVLQESDINDAEKALLLTALGTIENSDMRLLDLSVCEYCTAPMVFDTEGCRTCSAECWRYDEAIEQLVKSGVPLEQITGYMLVSKAKPTISIT